MTWLHRFAKLVVAATFLLVLAGGVVTSTGSGLSVPDWPSYGFALFRLPVWDAGLPYQHAHRLVATTVGFLTVLLVAWIRLVDRRRWVRVLSTVGLGVVILQGVIGGMSVLMRLPASIAITHACVALLFFCITVSLALVTSPGWLRAYRKPPPAGSPTSRPDRDIVTLNAVAADMPLRRLSIVTVVLVYAQIPIAATMKHVGAGLAIPDFPLAFGRLVPPLRLMASEQIAVHFLHRTWALVATVGLFLTAWRIWTRHAERQELTRPAALAPLLVLVQVSLGGLVVLSGRNLVIDTLHLATAALVLATSVVIALRAFRPLISTDAADLAARERRVVGSVPRASSASAMSAPGMNPARRGGR